MLRLRRVALLKPCACAAAARLGAVARPSMSGLPRREATSSTPEVSAGHRAAALVRRARPRVREGSLALGLQSLLVRIIGRCRAAVAYIGRRCLVWWRW